MRRPQANGRRPKPAPAPQKWSCQLGFTAPHASEADAKQPVRPSHALEETAGHRDSPGRAQARRAAAQRGRLIHLLLQHLPGVAAPNRRPAALAFLAARAAGLDEISRQNLAEEALAVIDLPELAGLYGPGSRAEVAVAGRLVLGQRTIDVAGQVDRIGEEAGDILLADYKTGTPCALAATPAALSHPIGPLSCRSGAALAKQSLAHAADLDAGPPRRFHSAREP